MTEERVERRLTTILAADVAGYSRLMGADEEGTLARLVVARRELVDPAIASHNGRIVKTTGDGMLVEFASVVDAVRCAVEVQRTMAQREAGRPEGRRLLFRMGINLGDIIVRDGDLYGDGVNVAARLEALADPGGVCISRTVRDHVRDRIDLPLDDVGEIAVKNIARPVRAFHVRIVGASAARRGFLPWRAAAAATVAMMLLAGVAVAWFWPWPSNREVTPEMALPLPDRPSLAVLPFRNLSNDPEQDYLADGFVETLTTDLARLPGLFVAARHAAFTYKGTTDSAQQIGAALGVAHVLEGSLQRSGDRVRVNAQLIQARTGHPLWSERFEEPADDLFRVQDAVARRVATALEVTLLEGDQARRWRSRSQRADSYILIARALEHFRRLTPEDNLVARRLASDVLSHDDASPVPLLIEAWSHLQAARAGWSDAPAADLAAAERLAQEVLGRDESWPESWALLGQIAATRGDMDKAIDFSRRAVQFGPNDADVHATAALTMIGVGRAKEALPLIDRAIRLSPHYPGWYAIQRGRALAALDRCKEAVPAFREAADRLPRSHFPRLGLAYCLGALNDEAEAQRAGADLLALVPDFNLTAQSGPIALFLGHMEEAWPRIVAALSLAGVPAEATRQ